MTPSEHAILKALDEPFVTNATWVERDWIHPRAFGSYVPAVRKMVAKGWVDQQRSRGHPAGGGGFRYRITVSGHRALEETAKIDAVSKAFGRIIGEGDRS